MDERDDECRTVAEAVVNLGLALREQERKPAPEVKAEAAPENYITADQAATIAGVKVTRIYEWSRSQKWACRISRRCLRVEEGAFRAWLTARGGQR